MRRYGIMLLVGLWGWALLQARTVVISGQDPGYAGKTIRVNIPSNPFLDHAGFRDTLVCDPTGSFLIRLDISSGTLVKLITGIYEASLYVEPGYTYRVQLPPYRAPTYPQRASPFFEPVRIHLKATGGPENVNNEIFRFDSLFTPLNDLLVLSRNRNQAFHLDSLIDALNAGFGTSGCNWFMDYRKYKAGILKLNEGRTGLETLSRDYLGLVVQETHPAYMELFSSMFRDFLVYYDRTREGKGIRYHINRTHNLDSLRQIIAGHPAVTSDTLGDLILLQELPALFYRSDFHKEAILILLDSLAATPAKPVFSCYASEIRKRLASLVTGNPPPQFTLKGTDGRSYSPSSFTGKYTYLLFCTPDHYGCLMEYPFLDSYVERHSENLEVVTVMLAGDETQVTSFMERNGYRFRALYCDADNEVLDDYRVKVFPMAYLVGRDGTLILSPAPLPSEGFEQQLFRIMRSRGEV
jgi:peroxiredoxin